MNNTKEIEFNETDIALNQVHCLIEDGIASNEDEAFEMAISDSDLMSWAYQDFEEQLQDILNQISPDGLFYVHGSNMGWRHLSGHAEITADTVRSYIEKAFPKTSEWTFHGVFYPSKGLLEYKLYHHDAPTGETYRITRR